MKIFRKILCFIGYHEWTWKFIKGTIITEQIPDHAKCKYCVQTYKK